ncbi:MAG: hypothetical protein H0T42_07135 [Deltaproteobacteria bacterium]|nr:hypothetical protein [Deltaproteobacteria bacterium]
MADIIDPPAAPVREEYEIKTEIDEAQQDLEQGLGELKDAILEKVDVKARVERVIDEKKDQAMDYVVRAREIAMDLYARGRAFVRDEPLLAVGIVGGVVLLAGAAFAVRRKVVETAVLD